MTDKKDNGIQKDKMFSESMNRGLFHHDLRLFTIYKRIQNIASALFLITNPLSETEVLKNSIRLASLKTLAHIVSIPNLVKIDEITIRQIGGSILELGSLVHVALWSNLISEMNASIIQKEIEKTQRDLEIILESVNSRFRIDPSLFKDIPEIPKEQSLRTSYNSTDLYKGQYKRQNIKDNIKDREISIGQSSSLSDNRSHRREAIIKLLGEKSSLTVRDFTSVIPEYSEKTIQRELLALVDEGIVKKQGERRWSTYSLSE